MTVCPTVCDGILVGDHGLQSLLGWVWAVSWLSQVFSTTKPPLGWGHRPPLGLGLEPSCSTVPPEAINQRGAG